MKASSTSCHGRSWPLASENSAPSIRLNPAVTTDPDPARDDRWPCSRWLRSRSSSVPKRPAPPGAGRADRLIPPVPPTTRRIPTRRWPIRRPARQRPENAASAVPRTQRASAQADRQRTTAAGLSCQHPRQRVVVRQTTAMAHQQAVGLPMRGASAGRRWRVHARIGRHGREPVSIPLEYLRRARSSDRPAARAAEDIVHQNAVNILVGQLAQLLEQVPFLFRSVDRPSGIFLSRLDTFTRQVPHSPS